MNIGQGFKFDADVLQDFIRNVYDGFDVKNDVDPSMWEEVLRIINLGTVEGISKSKNYTTHDDEFLNALKHSNEVFSAFKVHTMGNEMASKLYDENGNLKSFQQWYNDIKSISSHQCGTWLRTEFDTAVIRAHAAADWQVFEQNKDVMPNLRWMPTTSKEEFAEHSVYWLAKLTLPVDDPFWDKHHPGDHWNCKCSLEQTDEPENRDAVEEAKNDKPDKGLENNPGKDGVLFNDTHPYFPAKCSKCFAYKGVSNSLRTLFVNRSKNCSNCPYINNKIEWITDNLEAQ